MLGATVNELVARATWISGFVRLWLHAFALPPTPQKDSQSPIEYESVWPPEPAWSVRRRETCPAHRGFLVMLTVLQSDSLCRVTFLYSEGSNELSFITTTNSYNNILIFDV